MYPEETIIEKDTCTLMFTTALFTIARIGKQPRCPSTDEWIKKFGHIYTWNLERWNWWSYLQGSFPGDAAGKEPTCQCRKYEAGLILVGEDPLEKGKATHSSILAWRISWTIQSMGSQSQTWMSNFHFTSLHFMGCIYLFELRVFFFSGYILRSAIAGSFSSSIFSFLRNYRRFLWL